MAPRIVFPVLLASFLLSLPGALLTSSSPLPGKQSAVTTKTSTADSKLTVVGSGSHEQWIKRRALAAKGKSKGLNASPTGVKSLSLLRQAMKRQGITSYFQLMDQSGFTQVVTDLMLKFPVTFLVPPNSAVSAAWPRIKKMTPKQLQQLVGYHIVTKSCMNKFFVSVAKTTEFSTADYDYTLAKASEPGVLPMRFAHPRGPILGYMVKPNAYFNAKRNAIAHVVSAVFIPPKFN